jgi:hypothetical protein
LPPPIRPSLDGGTTPFNQQMHRHLYLFSTEGGVRDSYTTRRWRTELSNFRRVAGIAERR